MNLKSIDEDLYSRQLYVLGKPAMEKMCESKVLIVGMGGLGVEIAKNLVLAGVQNITVYDPIKTEVGDLCSQFFLNEGDIGLSRAERSLSKLQGLNPTVSISLWEDKFFLEDLIEFQSVVIAETNDESLLGVSLEHLSSFCHDHNIKLIHCCVRGLYYRVFCDLGPNFVVEDVNELDPQPIIVDNVTNDDDGLVTCVVEKCHGLQVGDLIQFNRVMNMEDVGTRTVKRLISSTQFLIGNTKEFTMEGTGGTVKKLSQSFTLEYEEYEAARKNKKAVMQMDFTKDHLLCLLAFLTLDHVKQRKGTRWTLQEFLEAAETLNKDIQFLPNLSKDHLAYLEKFSNIPNGCVAPVVSFLGGFVAQEVIKICTRKFRPLFQLMVGDFAECSAVRVEQENTSIEIPKRTLGCYQLLGKNTLETLSNLKLFLVGAGATGCELLKNFALLGVATGPHGYLTITDVDKIEKSNLTRQFLFRDKDIGRYKSVVAAEKVLEINREIKLKPLTLEVGVETESVFHQAFYSQIDVVFNAVDNKAARLYMDEKCVDLEIPLLDSGTQGTKGSCQVIIPHQTKCYREARDPEPEEFAKCTLTYFPYRIEHTIQWARDWFEETYYLCPKSAADFVNNKRDLSYYKQNEENGKRKLKQVAQFFRHEIPKSFEDCVELAHALFTYTFETSIVQLTTCYPRDSLTTEGLPFWNGKKRFPQPVKFNKNINLHKDFVESTANLYAAVYSIPEPDPFDEIVFEGTNYVSHGKYNVFSEVTVGEDNMHLSQGEMEEIYCKLPQTSSELSKLIIQPIVFEKDDMHNGHVKFIHSAAMLKGSNYSIDLVDILTTKKLAGKIIPAIVTTTSVVAGLVCMELIKLVNKKPNEGFTKFRDSYINLSTPSLLFVNPTASKVFNQNDKWNVWSKIKTSGKLTLKEFIVQMKDRHNVKVCLISCANLILFYALWYSDDDPIYMKTLNAILIESFLNVTTTKDKFCKLLVTDRNKTNLPPVFCYF